MDRRHFLKTSASSALIAGLPFGNAWAAGGAKKARIASDLDAVTRTGGSTTVSKAALQELSDAMRGQLLMADSDGYEDARQVWNGMIDKRPGVIARCSGAADVKHAVDFARSNDLLVAVRGGGHSISGKSVCEGGLMIDLAPMRGAQVDPAAKRARVMSGSLLGDLDHESQVFGLATTAGTVSHTGAAGLTLGGGHGRLGRRFGLTADNVSAFDIITADGEFRRARKGENDDLYWGLRGGGGNFGVVTSFEYQLHKVGPEVLGGGILFPFNRAKEVLEYYAEFSQNLPDEIGVDAVIVSRAGGPTLLTFDVCYSGDDMSIGESLMAPMVTKMKPAVNQMAPISYVRLQQRADAGTPPGRLYYNKAGLMTELTQESINALLTALEETNAADADPGRTTLIIMQHLGGAIAQRSKDATAYAHRDARYDFLALSGWDDPARSEENVGALRKVFKAVEPYTTGFYSNHMVDSDNPRARQAFRHNYDRLEGLKNQYDPTNLFQLNANIKPTV